MQKLDSHLTGTHGLNEELGRHRRREGKSECTLCDLLLHVMGVSMHVYVLVGVNVSVIMCILVRIYVHVCVAPPIVVGAWLTAETLWRLFEYYYYCE